MKYLSVWSCCIWARKPAWLLAKCSCRFQAPKQCARLWVKSTVTLSLLIVLIVGFMVSNWPCWLRITVLLSWSSMPKMLSWPVLTSLWDLEELLASLCFCFGFISRLLPIWIPSDLHPASYYFFRHSELTPTCRCPVFLCCLPLPA